MNNKKMPLATAVLLLLSGMPLLSVANNSDQQVIHQDMDKINQQTAAVEQQMMALQKELKSLKQEQSQLAAYEKKRTTPSSAKTKHTSKQPTQLAAANIPAPQITQGKSNSTHSATTATNQQAASNNVQATVAPQITAQPASAAEVGMPGHSAPPGMGGAQPQSNAELQQYYNDLVLKGLKKSGYMGGSPVVSSPYLGVRSQFDGSDLIVNISTINADLAILQQRQQFEDAAQKLGIPLSSHPRISISGEVQGQATYSHPFSGGNNSDINLTDAELDLVAEIDPWVTGYMVLEYDDGSTTPVNRVESSRIYLDRGVAILGNLNRFPVYSTIGQINVPFGQYNTYMISDPLTEDFGETGARTVILGYHEKNPVGLSAQLYAFKGDTVKRSSPFASPSNINNWGASTDYGFTIGKLNGDIGASYLYNIGDSFGMQSTGQSIPLAFGGFSDTTQQIGSPNPNALAHPVPAADVRTQLSYGPLTFIGEANGATRHFNVFNLSMNGRGAQPGAMDLQGVYTFKIFNKPTSFAVGYGQTWQALGLNLPHQRLLAAINMAVWKDTLASIEVRQSFNYKVHDFASGGNLLPFGILPATRITPLGPSETLITGQISLYF